MVQRLGLAIAFLKEVPLFVLDEPTVNLDPTGVDRLRRLLDELRTKGTTILFSSHQLQSALHLADRVAVLVNGELVKVEAAPLFRDAVTHETVIRVVVNAATDTIVEAARRAGADVSRRNAKQVLFKAMPNRRLQIIRAIEDAGASIEEVHTEAPDWESLVRKHFESKERAT
jgi:ABC-type multidrug transport system ATPase subunit